MQGITERTEAKPDGTPTECILFGGDEIDSKACQQHGQRICRNADKPLEQGRGKAEQAVGASVDEDPEYNRSDNDDYSGDIPSVGAGIFNFGFGFGLSGFRSRGGRPLCSAGGSPSWRTLTAGASFSFVVCGRHMVSFMQVGFYETGRLQIPNINYTSKRIKWKVRKPQIQKRG